MTNTLDLNPEITQALEVLLQTDKHVFITGCAGTGKSTLLKYFLTQVKEQDFAVLAPTGVAALNVGGETIHHFLRLGPAATRDEAVRYARRAKKTKNFQLYNNLDTIIIDEISMVRADLFDLLDIFLRTIRSNRQPFGGVRVICFGDLYQLPPVVRWDEQTIFTDYYQSPYFFSSDVFGKLWRDQKLANFAYIELKQVYRQNDDNFLHFLHQIRHNQLQPTDLSLINNQVLEISDLDDLDSHFVILTTTRARAQAINMARLQRLSSKTFNFHARVSGKFNQSSEPTDEVLTLKIGARVMMLNNDADGRWVNGSMGIVTSIDAVKKQVTVQLDDGGEEIVGAHTWEACRSVYDLQSGKIDKETIGSFKQFPLRLAWAVTIHKAQGKTFDKLIIDFERRAFAAGQAYVALSRGTCLEGVYLLRPLRHDDVQVDQQIIDFLAALQNQLLV